MKLAGIYNVKSRVMRLITTPIQDFPRWAACPSMASHLKSLEIPGLTASGQVLRWLKTSKAGTGFRYNWMMVAT